MFSFARARRCALGAQEKCAPRFLRFESLEIRNYLSASPNDVVITPQVSIIPSINLSVVGYTPAQVANAYGFNQINFGNVVGNGAGQTIAIVDAYDDPSIANNLSVFDKQFGLPDPKFTKVNQTGGSTMPIASQNWAMEISLDVEWAHAMAPGANILLVEANSSSLTDLLTAVNYARSQPGVSVVSMSWGAGEFSGQQSFDSYFTTPAGHTGETFVASSGDGGAGANWPAVSPNVVAVGGTTLSISGTTYVNETAWSGSGGGTSSLYSTPSYQVGVQTTGHRTVPDVSFGGNPSTGFAVYDTAGGSAGWMQVGGTSAGAPQWAALVAIANQGRALSNQAALSGTDTNLYKLSASDFHDITIGSNGAYTAKAGYDEVTGRGSPYANLVVRDLVNATFTAPAAPAFFVGPRIVIIPTGGAGGNSIVGAGGDDFNYVAASVSINQLTVVGATGLVTSTSAAGSPMFFSFVDLRTRPAAGTAGIVEEEASQVDTITTPESESIQQAATTEETTTVEAPVASDVDAALSIEMLDSIEAEMTAADLADSATPGAAASAFDACFVEDEFVAAEHAVMMSEQSASEHPASTSLAVLAGFVIGGWRPAASAARAAALVQRRLLQSVRKSDGSAEGTDD